MSGGGSGLGACSKVQCIMANGHVWKHYLPALSLAGGNEVYKMADDKFLIGTVQGDLNVHLKTYNRIINSSKELSSKRNFKIKRNYSIKACIQVKKRTTYIHNHVGNNSGQIISTFLVLYLSS